MKTQLLSAIPPRRQANVEAGVRRLSLLVRSAARFSLLCLVAHCGNSESMGVRALSLVSAGVINDPANKSLRFDLLQYGLGRFCLEMRRRGAPIKLSDHTPVMGRFFADGCDSQVLDQAGRQSVVVRYSGTGYGWTNVSGRLGFASTGLVEYAADFQLHDDSMYIYFRPRNVGSATFQTLMVESLLAKVGLGLPGIDADALGREIITSQLQRGFTVIRHSSRGDTEFASGLVPLGKSPFHPFQVRNSDNMTLDNDRTEVHWGQQDFLGGLRVEQSGQRLIVNATLDGARALDLFVLTETDARAMASNYIRNGGPALPPRGPLLDGQLVAGQPLRLELNVPPGTYTVVFDHSSGLGRSNPPAGEPPAKIDYLIQVGER